MGRGDRGLRGLIAGSSVLVLAGVTLVALGVGRAEHGGRVADATRVEGHDVVCLDDGLADSLRRVVGQRGDDGASGAARVNEQGRRILVAGSVDRECKRDLVTVRVRPVERRLQEGALVLAGVRGVHALERVKGTVSTHAPLDRLIVVGLHGPRGHGDRRGRGRGRRRGGRSPALGSVVADDGQDDRDDGEDCDGAGRNGACLHGPDCNGETPGQFSGLGAQRNRHVFQDQQGVAV